MNLDEGNGSNKSDAQASLLPYLDTTSALMFPPYQMQNFPGFPNAFKRLSIQIGCQQKDGFKKNRDGNGVRTKKDTKRFPKILKVINDPNVSVEDWLHDFLCKDVGNEKLGSLIHGANETGAANNNTAPLTLSLGPNRSIIVEFVKANGRIKYVMSPSGENGQSKKRNRNKRKTKSLKVELVESGSGDLFSPRDPILLLVGSIEEVVLRLAGEGSWESQEIETTSSHMYNVGENMDIPMLAETETLREESPPAKRQKLRKQPPKSLQQPGTKSKKGSISESREEKKSTSSSSVHQGTNDSLGADGEDTMNHGLECDKEDTKSKATSTRKARNEKIESNSDENDSSSDDDDVDEKEEDSSNVLLSPISKKSPSNIGTRPEHKNRRSHVDKREEHSAGFSDQDVLLGNGSEQRQNSGNMNYKNYIDIKSTEYADKHADNALKKRIIDGVLSKFRFFKKNDDSGSWCMLEGCDPVVKDKIRRDFNNRKGNTDPKETEHQEGQKAVDKKAIENVRQTNTDDSSSQESAEKGESDSDNDEENEDSIQNSESSSLSDEASQIEKEGEEEDEGDQNDEQSDEGSISAKSLEDKTSASVKDDSDGADDSSSSGNRALASPKSSSSTESDDKTGNKNDSSERLHSGPNISRGKNLMELESQRAGLKGDNNGNDDENENGRKEFGSQPASAPAVKSHKKDSTSSNSSDDDSDTSPSDESSISSSSESSSSESSSSESSSSDDDSTSSSSVSEDSSDTERKGGSEHPRIVQTKSIANSGSDRKEHPQQSARKSKKRKPLLDPGKRFLFPDADGHKQS